LVLPAFTGIARTGCRYDAGSGDPAYNAEFDRKFHVLVLPGFTRTGVAPLPQRVREKWWLWYGKLWGGWFVSGREIGFTCFYRE
jgi:hypothetical protein